MIEKTVSDFLDTVFFNPTESIGNKQDSAACLMRPLLHGEGTGDICAKL